MSKPIKSQKQADKVEKYLISEMVKTLGIDKQEAVKRIDALFKSGIMDEGNPSDQMTQMKIDAFLQIPSEKYYHLK